MSDEIKPALTPEEWSDRAIFDDGSALSININGELINHAWGQSVDRPFAVMALANAALPDDDPRKFTQKDVQEIRDAIGSIEGEWGTDEDDLRALAAKIAALLPPENVVPTARET